MPIYIVYADWWDGDQKKTAIEVFLCEFEARRWIDDLCEEVPISDYKIVKVLSEIISEG